MPPEREIDAERLAALLDGKLSPSERDALLVQLSESDEMMAVYADAVAAHGSESQLRELQPDAARRSTRVSSFFTSKAGWAIAATVLVALTGTLLVRRGGSGAPDVGALVAGLSSADRGVPLELREHPWSGVRGEGAGAAVSATGRAARLAVLSVDLDLALRARDSLAVPLAREISALLSELPASAPIVALYRNVERDAMANPDVARTGFTRAQRATTALVDANVFGLAASVEAARVAMVRADSSYLAKQEGIAANWARRVLAGSELTDVARRALADFIAAHSSGASPVRSDDLTNLITALAR